VKAPFVERPLRLVKNFSEMKGSMFIRPPQTLRLDTVTTVTVAKAYHQYHDRE
jgi:hypothetical protein